MFQKALYYNMQNSNQSKETLKLHCICLQALLDALKEGACEGNHDLVSRLFYFIGNKLNESHRSASGRKVFSLNKAIAETLAEREA